LIELIATIEFALIAVLVWLGEGGTPKPPHDKDAP
jgi:hypothetical protein